MYPIKYVRFGSEADIRVAKIQVRFPSPDILSQFVALAHCFSWVEPFVSPSRSLIDGSLLAAIFICTKTSLPLG
jgi:hypothetical protein